MTTPTQAQIEAAAKSLITFAPYGRLDECAAYAKAALSAATQVVEQELTAALAANKALAIQANKIKAATIELCALACDDGTESGEFYAKKVLKLKDQP